MRLIRLALGQFNPTVGDIGGNTDKMLEFISQALEEQADIVAFPELAITGYPPEDLLFKKQFLLDSKKHLQRIVKESGNTTVVVGAPEFIEGEPFHLGATNYPDQLNGRIYNSAVVASNGQIVNIYRKIFLPNYGVFDEQRYFSKGTECPVFSIHEVNIGVNICEDIWYEKGPTSVQRANGAELIVNINASPFHLGRGAERYSMLSQRARSNKIFVSYINAVGGQDELVFDGQSIILDPEGKIIARSPQFRESLLLADINADQAKPFHEIHKQSFANPKHYFIASGNRKETKILKPSVAEELEPCEEAFQALVLGTRDYVKKSGFNKAVIGLSGGLDSALTTVIAVEALGSSNVTAFFMPSQYTSDQSLNDSKKLSANLGIRMVTLPIEPIFNTYIESLASEFQGTEIGTTEENLQARIRGNLLMAASNKFNWIVLTTGNKSEMATGYATLYGDMAGGFAVIKDVSKTLVKNISIHLNEASNDEIIPYSIINRAPTAELRPDQKDEDSLPPYDELDLIISAYVEEDKSIEDMASQGMAKDSIDLTVNLVDKSEYKRRQSPPGVKITKRNFGRDRRLPIANRYKQVPPW